MKELSFERIGLFITGFFGFYGFKGFAGISGDFSDLLYLVSFAFFANFIWAKIGVFEDERLKENKQKAGAIAFRTGLTVVFLLSFVCIYFALMYPTYVSYELLYKVELIIVLSTFAVCANLWAALTYIFEVRG